MLRALLAVAAMAGLLLGGYWAVRLGLADALARRRETGAVAQAVSLAPGHAGYYARLAAALDESGEDPPAAFRALETAVALNPGYSAGWIALGLRKDAHHELGAAERCLLEAARVDRTFEPCWTLANYYFRRKAAGEFWRWARRAAELAYADASPLFRLCWRVTPDAGVILERAVPNRAAALAQYLKFLLAEDHLEGAERAAERLIETGEPEPAATALGYCDRMLERAQPEPALRVWNRLAGRGLIERPPLAPEQGESLTNGDFSRDPLGRGFDWRLPSSEGVSVTRGEGGVRVAFSGRQPESCESLWQWAPVEPGRDYRLSFDYRTEGVASPSGLGWQFREAGSGEELAVRPADLAADTWRRGEAAFQTGAQTRLIRLALRYRRAPGTARAEGALWLRGVRLERARRAGRPPEPPRTVSSTSR